MNSGKLAWAALAILLIPAFVIPSPTSDFPAWIVGAHLAGDAARLYSFDESQKITGAFAEPRNGVWAFVRPPVYASLLKPLAWLSAPHAYVAWQLLNIAAFGIALWLIWPSRWALVTVLFPPLFTSFKQGQDMPLFLLAVAVSARLMRSRPFLAGAALAFLGLKFHLILLIPVFFVMKRCWRMASGFLAGAALLLAACFALYGTSWITLYPRFVMENQRHLQPSALVEPFGPVWFALLLAVAVGLMILMGVIRSEETALFTTLAIGLVTAPHLYPYDLVLGMPLLLLMLCKYGHPASGVSGG